MVAATSGAGYSGTPLAKKLGIGAGARVLLIGAPDGYLDWLAPLPAGVVWDDGASAATDVVHLFTARSVELDREVAALRTALRPDAALWVSWPKKASRVPTDITEDTIRAVALPLGWVDVKVCAVSAVWSGLKLVLRRDLRPARPRRPAGSARPAG